MDRNHILCLTYVPPSPTPKHGKVQVEVTISILLWKLFSLASEPSCIVRLWYRHNLCFPLMSLNLVSCLFSAEKCFVILGQEVVKTCYSI